MSRMADTFSISDRSRIMARIRAINTKPEKLVRTFLRANGFRLRSHVRSLPGKPDIVVPRKHAVIFVNGCFWHGHAGCKRATFPSTRRGFWKEKILGNAARDRRTHAALRRKGWRVITVWECRLSRPKLDRSLRRLLHWLRHM